MICIWWIMSCADPKASSTLSERCCSASEAGCPFELMCEREPGGVGGICGAGGGQAVASVVSYRNFEIKMLTI